MNKIYTYVFLFIIAAAVHFFLDEVIGIKINSRLFSRLSGLIAIILTGIIIWLLNLAGFINFKK